MSKKAKKCSFCGKQGVITKDHIPPKCLFPQPLPNNLITVKACPSCNGGSSNDDQYLQAILVMREESGMESQKL